MIYWLLKTKNLLSSAWLTERHTLEDMTKAKRFESEEEAKAYAVKIYSETFLEATKYEYE